jgi:hypothetical protein
MRALLTTLLFLVPAAAGATIPDSEIIYVGCVEASGSNLPVATALRPGARGLTGFYVLLEPDGRRVEGSLGPASRKAAGDSVRFRWKDEYGEGDLVIEFSADASSFNGFWTTDGDSQPSAWWGREGVISLLQSQDCSDKGST